MKRVISIPRFLTAGKTGFIGVIACALLFSMTAGASVETPAVTGYTALPGALPDAGSSVLRVLGALALVTALFLGGVWLFRNWQRFTVRKGGAPRLNVIEVKSLGQRHALYVVGYEQQRMLLASSPTGVSLVSHLPEAAEGEESATIPQATFSQALQQVFQRKA